MARPTADTEQITFRIPTEWLATADRVAQRMSSPTSTASRTDALRAAIARGFEALDYDWNNDEQMRAAMEKARQGKKVQLAEGMQFDIPTKPFPRR